MINDNESRLIFIEQAKVICNNHPDLSWKFENNKPCIIGKIHLLGNENKISDSYVIKIVWSQGYPYRFPLVYEIGGRIPVNIEWHIFETDSHCCIKAFPEEIMLCRKGINLEWFIRSQLIPYLFNQSFRQENGYYYHERSHGVKGTIESFADIFRTTNVSIILKLLSFLKEKREHKSTAKCVCGSNSKYKKCHRRAFRKLSALRVYNITNLILEIKKYQNTANH